MSKGTWKSTFGFSFALQNALFGLLASIIFCVLSLIPFWRVILIGCFAYFPLFACEAWLHQQIDLLSSDIDHVVNPWWFVACSIYFSFQSVWTLNILFSSTFWVSVNCTENSFLASYSQAIFMSIAIFSLFLSLKLAIVRFPYVKLYWIKRGFFGLFHRVVIWLRSVFVTYIWVRFLSESPSETPFSAIFHYRDALTTTKLYLALKCLFFTQLLWDFDSMRREFLLDWWNSFTVGHGLSSCSICHQEVPEYIILPCGHELCLNCYRLHLPSKPFCPICKVPIMAKPKFAFADGSLSISAIFCCF
jgi:hypothetical protein